MASMDPGPRNVQHDNLRDAMIRDISKEGRKNGDDCEIRRPRTECACRSRKVILFFAGNNANKNKYRSYLKYRYFKYLRR